MESDLDLDVEINNDVKDPNKSEIFDVTNHLNDPGEEKLSNSNSVPRSDFVAKYAHLEEFFKLESSKPRENGIFDMEFSCVKCLPGWCDLSGGGFRRRVNCYRVSRGKLFFF